MQNKITSKYYVLIALFFIGLIWSGISPHDYFTWILEVFPAIIGFIVLAMTFNRFRLSFMTYCFILAHCYILFVGGHYTYAEVPLFEWIREAFNQSRNNYDKVGHFAQGFVPALLIREIFVRKNVINSKPWLPFLTVSVCITISAFYEFLEWGISLVSGEAGDSFLGTQGYIWDTQSDMFYALIGSLCMIFLFSKLQNKVIERVK